jgi:hypothetical protein
MSFSAMLIMLLSGNHFIIWLSISHFMPKIKSYVKIRKKTGIDGVGCLS